MSTATDNPVQPGNESPETMPAALSARRQAGGITSLGKGFMPPVFTAFLVLAILDIFVLLLLPYGLNRGTDSAWAQGPRLAFMALSVLAGLVFGLLASITADRRGHSAWWFLAGHMGALAAPAVAVTTLAPLAANLIVASTCIFGTLVCLVVVGKPRETAISYGPVSRGLSRFCFQCGNIWLGISLLSVLVLGLIQGTRYEDMYGHKAAFSIIYGSWWFGLLYMAFAVSLFSATIRKYPWRVDQSGWLVVHAALMLIILGTFMTFWGKKDGVLRLAEGESASAFHLYTETRLQILEKHSGSRAGPATIVDDVVVDFDLDPSELYPHATYNMDLGSGNQIDITVENYYPSAKQEREFSNNGPRRVAALTGSLIPPRGGRGQEFTLVEGRGRGPMPGLISMEFKSNAGANPEVPAGSIWFVPNKNVTGYDWIHRSRGGTQNRGRVVENQALGLGLPMKIQISETFTHFTMTDTVKFDGYQALNQVIRVTFPESVLTGDHEIWLSLYDSRGHAFRFANRDYTLRWTRSSYPLGFTLRLEDFHRNFYPGSSQAKTFESYLVLTDRQSDNPTLRDGASVKIDMNHPLRYKGWRLFQSSFDDRSSQEVTFLQTNRDPGRNVTYVACLLLSLGLIIVFFQKRFLRAWGRHLNRVGANATQKVLGGAAVVVLGFVSCLPGYIVILLIEKGPLLLVGALLIVLFLTVESVLLSGWAARRLEAGSPARPVRKEPAGALK